MILEFLQNRISKLLHKEKVQVTESAGILKD